LVLGGYGQFGARIVRALAGQPDTSLWIGGRDHARASALAQEVDALPFVVDALAPDLSQRLRAERIGLVIHTAGPFQHQDWRVAEAAAAAGAHYLDLADGRRFVCDFAAALDARFRAARRCAITGASTLPGLSTAVIDHLTAGWQRIDTIDCCVAPAQTVPRGVATVAAVLSYCGEPIRVWQDGRWVDRHGWATPTDVHFARLASRQGALCDVPDLELLPQQYPGVRSVMFRAALELAVAQRGFALLAGLRRARLLRRPERLAGLLHWAAGQLDRFGSDRGGMLVDVSGRDALGRHRRRRWHLTADRGHGPEVPCMPAVILARRLARGEPPPPGASPCAGLVSLAELEPEFRRWGMVTETLDEAVD
jgi:hypothetical protein